MRWGVGDAMGWETPRAAPLWIPAFAGMTRAGEGVRAGEGWWWRRALRQAQGERIWEARVRWGVGDAMGWETPRASPLWIPAFAGMTRAGEAPCECWSGQDPSTGSGRTVSGARVRWGVGVDGVGDAPRGAPLDSCLRRNDACGRPPSSALRTGFDRLRANGCAPHRAPALDSLDSQTKCNTRVGCCHGKSIYAGHHGRAVWIARLRAQGSSVRQIAAGVDRPPSTVARELKRNGSRTLGYQPRYANQQAHARRWRGSRLERDGPLREQVLAGLGAGWSPAQVAGRLALDEGRCDGVGRSSPMRASTGSSTPRWRGRRTTPGGTTCPGPRPSAAFGAGAAMQVTHIAHRVPLSQRPRAAADQAPPLAIGRGT